MEDLYTCRDDPTKVITCGVEMDTGKRIICEEYLSDYQGTLQRIKEALPKVYTYE